MDKDEALFFMTIFSAMIRIIFFSLGVRLSPLGTEATTGVLSQPRMIDDECGTVGEMRIDRLNRNNRGKTATVPATNLTWPDQGSNLGRRGGSRRLASHLSYDE
jgi:hypothetical protein